MKTLVVSDLHLGARLQRDVLRRPAARHALLDALDDVDRLVLLGDVVELLEGRPRHAMDAAEPILRAVGARLGADREVVYVPGNHDHTMIRPWLRARRTPLDIETHIPLDATPALWRMTRWLGPARVTVRYPGVWLGDGVFATHGHYLDRHLLPVSSIGVARGLLRRPARDSASVGDYESGHHPVSTLDAILAAWLPTPLSHAADELVKLLRHATMPTIPMASRLPGSSYLAPLGARLLGLQMRRAALPALARVVQRLGIEADHVIFGHVHRNGPRDDDDPALWTGAGGTPRLHNTGCWVYEAMLLARARPGHPYWPGGAVVIDDGAPPRAVALLGDLPDGALRPGR